MATATNLRSGHRMGAFDSIAASQSDVSHVAALTGHKIRVHAVVINHGDTTPSAVTFSSGGSTALTPALKGPANGGFVIPQCEGESGWFETLSGEALTIDTGAGSTTGIMTVFEYVKARG
jgi:hypothetical protein